MSESISRLLAEFAAIADTAQSLAFLPRDKLLQAQAADNADRFLAILASHKDLAVAASNSRRLTCCSPWSLR